MEAITWDHVRSLANDLSSLIRKSECRPNLIVAVARGGFIPARLLSDGIGVKKLSSIGITYTDSSRSRREVYTTPSPLGAGDSVLLVEDALESGRSLAEARDILADKGATVWTAALYYRFDSVVKPDFSLGALDKIPSFPWE
ncbi:phosphoribosyltransferase [Amycolatopsis sp. CA-126428]|uniref:phosphoribosyltransferase n=1 Tax=Amycolatopsis sp. CA-126428 TaxID=2073158 RepID=UPI000CD11028|nr:phosphoribosyltransferase family protein [Amycolatopsis sp. CA-126428]